MFSNYRRAAPRRSPRRPSHSAALRSRGKIFSLRSQGRRGRFARKGWVPDTLMGPVASSLESAVKPSGRPSPPRRTRGSIPSETQASSAWLPSAGSSRLAETAQMATKRKRSGGPVGRGGRSDSREGERRVDSLRTLQFVASASPPAPRERSACASWRAAGQLTLGRTAVAASAANQARSSGRPTSRASTRGRSAPGAARYSLRIPDHASRGHRRPGASRTADRAD
jgi:hypothetical protein